MIYGYGGQVPSRDGQPCTGAPDERSNSLCECVPGDGGSFWHCAMPIGGPLMPPELPG